MSDNANAMTFAVEQPVDMNGVTQEAQILTAQTAPQLNDKQKTFQSVLPEAYKGKEFVQNFLKADDPFEAALKGYESAQQMIGKATAPQAPASPDEYKYEVPTTDDETINAFLKAARADDTLKQLKAKAHEAGMTAKQFETFMKDGIDTAFINQHREAIKGMKQLEDQNAAEFETIADEIFGTQKPQAIEQAKQLIEALLPPKLKDKLPQVDNNALVILAAFANETHKRFISPDKSFSQGGRSVSAGVNRDPNSPEFKAELYELMKHEAYSNEFHPQHAAQKAAVHRHLGLTK